MLKSMFKKISEGVLPTIQYFSTLPHFSENRDQTRKVFMTGGTDDVLLIFLCNSSLPMTIHNTIRLPTTATKSMPPNRISQTILTPKFITTGSTFNSGFSFSILNMSAAEILELFDAILALLGPELPYLQHFGHDFRGRSRRDHCRSSRAASTSTFGFLESYRVY